MGFLDDCKNYFGTDDLYVILSINKEATESQIKSAYRKLSLKVHPDRANQDKKEEATKKFQILNKIHYILSDKDLRGVYDETGTVIDENDLNDKANWNDYWRLIFPKITVKDIEAYIAKYKGSKDEKDDIKKYYERFQGDMDKISECIIGFEEDRVTDLIMTMLDDGQLQKYDKFVNEPKEKKEKRMKKAVKEAKLAEKASKKRKVEDENLVNAIQSRSKSNFENMINQLEEKYSKNSNGNKKKKRKN